jgi:hypothetical protein
MDVMIRAGAVLLILAAAPAETPTCNIPVFRYALERWPAAPYDVVAFHRGPLTDEQGAALNVLRAAGANLELDRIDVADPLPPKRRKVVEKLKLQAPCLVALYPGSETAAWTGPLTVAAAKGLTESPARREVSKRLLAGESGVWLLLNSGDVVKDAAAVATLQKELKALERSLKLPAHAADDPPLLSDLPVKVAFSILRVDRKDAAESALVSMLMNSDTNLNGPVVFPIFGRGRALWAMAGDGLNARYISEAGLFLTGACSCEAKEFNPGVDLLFAADWEAGLAAAPERERIPEPVLKPRPAEPETTSSAPSGSTAFLWAALLVAGLFVALTGRKVLSSRGGK